MPIRTVVWGENVHDSATRSCRNLSRRHAPVHCRHLEHGSPDRSDHGDAQDPDHGLSAERLAATDVLVWWGHVAMARFAIMSSSACAMRSGPGMGIVFLHSAHFSKPFKRLMGGPCNLTWREAGERERLWVTSRNHPITAGLPDSFRAGNGRNVRRALWRAGAA